MGFDRSRPGKTTLDRPIGGALVECNGMASSMAKYGDSAAKHVESAMRRRKRGTLRSGKPGPGKGKKVTSRSQAIAIGLSEARRKGGKVPPPSGRRHSRTRRTRSRKS